MRFGSAEIRISIRQARRGGVTRYYLFRMESTPKTHFSANVKCISLSDRFSANILC